MRERICDLFQALLFQALMASKSGNPGSRSQPLPDLPGAGAR
jgi:hypothetical protein